MEFGFNLTYGRIAAAHGRFSPICQVAQMCTLSSTCFLGPNWVHVPNGISIGSAVSCTSHDCDIQTNRPTNRPIDRPRYSVTIYRIYSVVLRQCCEIRLMSYVFEDHEVVEEKHALTGEQFPDCLAPLSLRTRHRLWRHCRFRCRHDFRPMAVLSARHNRVPSWRTLASRTRAHIIPNTASPVINPTARRQESSKRNLTMTFDTNVDSGSEQSARKQG